MRNMRNRYVVAAALLLVALAISANATAFVYRWLVGQVNILQDDPDQARGILCTGFYSSAAQEGINLPSAGTNYNAPTFVGQGIQVTPGAVECRWLHNNRQYALYESIQASFSLTVGNWYIKDFYGFGYYQRNPNDPGQVYVSFRVANALNEAAGIVEARLFVYNAQNNQQVANLDLKVPSGFTQPIALPANGAFRLSLYIESNSQVQNADFRIDFAVSPSNEQHE
ncbi:MAG: hypothetical protein NZ902_05210 [Acidilobaceae archaeon]|nr:hypothetical protein [Acidilobaceae archaeon]MDW7974608.1 hypothetical protein [Sulfolobales archaeon]